MTTKYIISSNAMWSAKFYGPFETRLIAATFASNNGLIGATIKEITVPEEKPRAKYSDYMYLSLNLTGELSMKFKENAPAELVSLPRHIMRDHFAMCLSNQWIHLQFYQAFVDLEPLTPQAREDFCPYKYLDDKEATQWLNDNCNAFAISFCEKSLKTLGTYAGFSTVLCHAYRTAQDCIYSAVANFLNAKEKE